MRARRLAAGWILPVEGAPIERGAVLIGDDGRILAVGPEQSVPRVGEAPAPMLDDAIVVPGFVNTHTHLELTGLGGEPPEPDFPAWIQRVRAQKATRSSSEFLTAARAGLAACHAAGVTFVADTGDSGAAVRALAESGAAGIAYHEVFGPDPDQASESLRGMQARLEELGEYAIGRVRLGVSPHAPYTVSGRLYAAVAAWASGQGLPLATHIAESLAESDLLARGTGGFAAMWRARSIPLPDPLGCTPVEWLERHSVLGPGTLCIHGVQAAPTDLDRLADAGASLAHCPLSNRAHRHGTAPLAAALARGLAVGLGTDSVLSVGELDLLAEARAARQIAGLGAAEALELGTLGGARALGLERETGSLRPGKWADCVVIRPRSATAGQAPEERVLSSRVADVVATYVGGREVYLEAGSRRSAHYAS